MSPEVQCCVYPFWNAFEFWVCVWVCMWCVLLSWMGNESRLVHNKEQQLYVTAMVFQDAHAPTYNNNSSSKKPLWNKWPLRDCYLERDWQGDHWFYRQNMEHCKCDGIVTWTQRNGNTHNVQSNHKMWLARLSLPLPFHSYLSFSRFVRV